METIKTWQERCTDGQHNFVSFNEARDAEIADLRAALAKQADSTADFEAWATSECLSITPARSESEDKYIDPDTELAWYGWQAALAQRAGNVEEYGYAVESNDGRIAFFKKDPTGFRQPKWHGLMTVHSLYTSPPSQPGSERDAALTDEQIEEIADEYANGDIGDFDPIGFARALLAAMAAQQSEKGEK